MADLDIRHFFYSEFTEIKKWIISYGVFWRV